MIFIIFVVIALAIFIYLKIQKDQYNGFVQKNSITLKKLLEINNRYSFHPLKNYIVKYTYDNENFYNDISCRDHLIYNLQFDKRELLNQIAHVKENNKNYKLYKKELNAISDNIGSYQCDTQKFKLKKLNKIEKTFFAQHLLKPQLDFLIIVNLYCAKMNGIVYRRKSVGYSIEEAESIIEGLNDKTGYFYRRRDIWDAICRVERGKVSNKLRFAIYKRDGYRCRCCGASGQYSSLEIDHIIPIAKGGKSTYKNLQTLCHKCNVKKGDSLPY